MAGSGAPKGQLVAAGLVVLVVLAALVIAGVNAVSPARFVDGQAEAGLRYKLYVPSGHNPQEPAPLVVVLHGCLQDPDQIAQATLMNELAERRRFLVAYPDKRSSPWPHRTNCWSWFDSMHQTRGGEAAAIASVPAAVSREYAVDGNRVFVVGQSAGGAMAAILGATYPDVFAAIGVDAGVEFQAARSEAEAMCPTGTLCRGGPDPGEAGTAAFRAMGANARVVPVIVFFGTADTTVNPINGEQVVAQWAQTDDLASDGRDDDNISVSRGQETPGQVRGGHPYYHAVYTDATTGQPVIERYRVEGMQHAWSGGDPGTPRTDPSGPNATGIVWRFFEEHPRQPPR